MPKKAVTENPGMKRLSLRLWGLWTSVPEHSSDQLAHLGQESEG